MSGTERLQIKPGTFDLAYLPSKAAGGLILKRLSASAVIYALPTEPTALFSPHAMPAAERFIYSAEYLFPLQPMDDTSLLTQAQFKELFHQQTIEQYMAGPAPQVHGYQLISNNRVFVKITVCNLGAI